MIRTGLMLLGASMILACGGQQAQENVVEGQATDVRSYGAVITADDVIDADMLLTELEETDTVACAFSGTIQETCAKKGCWMTLDAGMDDEMRVRFTDYGFFVPTEGQSGKKTVVKGIAYKSVTPVDELKHYAEDAGKSKEEIDAITEPEVSVAFLADGVLIYD
ncbi:MAG: DUF4920 domain-containing protein [Flavobacteriales bacterium]|nr:DUF4920 domain-containing protein [Flavobacteriales bacterium]